MMLCVLLACVIPAHGQPGNNNPVKIVLVAETQTIRLGEVAKLECLLVDKDNKTVKAPRNLSVEVTAKSAANHLSQTNFIFKAGEGSAQVAMYLGELGAAGITAKSGGLLSRGTIVMVKAGGVMVAPPPARPATDPVRRTGVAAPAMRLAHLAPPNFTITPNSGTPVGGNPKPIGLILKSRSEEHLADGTDAVSIMVFLDESYDAAPFDITIELYNRAGALTPKPLVIKKGLTGVEAQLTSDRVGEVVVDFQRSSPAARIQGPASITNKFGPPITTLRVSTDRSSISLIEKCNLVVECLDKNDRTVATDVERHVSLSITNGTGALATNDVVIPAGSARGQTGFTPIKWGSVSIIASTPDLFEATMSLPVTVPMLLLTLSLLGGLLGGGISAVSEKPKAKSSLQRAAIGIVTGFVLYWACIFMNSYIKMPAEVALNPFSGFAVSTVGGFAGTKILSAVLKHL